MNRRKKKKQQVDYVAVLKEKVAGFDVKQKLDSLKQVWDKLPKLHQRALMVLVPLVLILLILPAPKKVEQVAVPEVSDQRVPVALNSQSLSNQKSEQQSSLKSTAWREYQVQQGDTLAQVFRSNSLSMADLNALVKIEGSDKPLSRITQGQLIRFKQTKEGELDMLQLERQGKSVMFFRLSDGSFGRNK